MSEEIEHYNTNPEGRSQLIFIAKRLSDVAIDLERLSEEEKKFVVERVDKLNPIGLVELFNALLEYMD